jgi:hypothetical protein
MCIADDGKCKQKHLFKTAAQFLLPGDKKKKKKEMFREML